MPPPDNTTEGMRFLLDRRTLTILGVIAAAGAIVGALIAYFAR
jgi:hypothetical protein